MIGYYVKAENLKFKRTFSRKMIFIVPLINICFAFLMNPGFFVAGTYNWWSVILMPVMIALLCAQSHQKEKKASNYNGIFSSPVDLHQIWYAKISVIALYSLASQAVFLGFMVGMQFVIPQFSSIHLTVIAAESVALAHDTMGDPRLFMDSAKVRVYICRFVQYAGHYHIGHHVGIKPFLVAESLELADQGHVPDNWHPSKRCAS